MADIQLGVVSEVTDERKFIIKATIKGYIEDVLAYPIDTFDKPEVGDPVVLYGLETIFGYSWMYQKQRLNEKTEIHFGDAEINITSAEDDATKSEIEVKNAKCRIFIDKDGNITIDNDKDITVNSSGKVNVNADSDITIKTQQGGEMDLKSKVSLKNTAQSLYSILDNLLQSLGTTAPTTMGSPAAQNFNPAIVTAINMAKTNLGLLME